MQQRASGEGNQMAGRDLVQINLHICLNFKKTPTEEVNLYKKNT